MTHDEAEQLRRDDQYWTFNVVYRCRADPRLVVRNRFAFGWIWNFGHARVYPAILAAIVFSVGPPYFLASLGDVSGFFILLVFVVLVAILAYFGHREASGPR